MSSEENSNSEDIVIEEHMELLNHELDCLLQWITLLNETMHAILAGSCDARDLEVFFVKLHGLLAEGLPHIQMQFLPRETIDLINLKIPNQQFPDDFRQLCIRVYEVFDLIQRAVSKDELEALEYLRHKASHPFIESYRFTLKNGKPKLERKGENKRVLRHRIENNIDKSGGFRLFAFSISERIQKNIPSLLSCIQIQCIRRRTPGSTFLKSKMPWLSNLK